MPVQRAPSPAVRLKERFGSSHARGHHRPIATTFWHPVEHIQSTENFAGALIRSEACAVAHITVFPIAYK
jgi:hypothetical protein